MHSTKNSTEHIYAPCFFMRRAQDGQAKKPFFQKRKKGFFAQDKQRKKEGRISFTLPKNLFVREKISLEHE